MKNIFGVEVAEWEFMSAAQRTAIREANDALAEIGLEPTGFRVAGPTPPEWAPGDVVVVRFNDHTKPYTHVRGADDWPGDGLPHADASITRLFRRGKAIHVMRNGQLTDAGMRMAAEQADLWSGAQVNGLAMAKYGDSRAVGQIDAFRTGFAAARDLLADEWTPFATEAGS